MHCVSKGLCSKGGEGVYPLNKTIPSLLTLQSRYFVSHPIQIFLFCVDFSFSFFPPPKAATAKRRKSPPQDKSSCIVTEPQRH